MKDEKDLTNNLVDGQPVEADLPHKKKRKFTFLEKRLQEVGTHTSVVLEYIVAVLVFVACAYGIICLFPQLYSLLTSGSGDIGFTHFIENVFTVVVGIEFLKMLCKPCAENVLETIIFLLARHMIIGESTAVGNLLYVIAIVILVLTRISIVIARKKLNLSKNEL